jgi:hypothetical protein
MKWIKKGLIFRPQNNYGWMISHASIPLVDSVNDEELRIYFGTRDRQGRSLPTYLEVFADDPQQILYIHDQPILSLGKLGTFDDNGIMPSWIVNNGNKKYLYYIGWNPQVTVPYRLSIGLAISEDGGQSFAKYSEGPIFDRDIDEPYFKTAPCVIHDGDTWKMWYVSCTGWEIINQRPEPRYHVKYAVSDNGIHWQTTNYVCIDYDSLADAIGRPCVLRRNGIYRMFYSYRAIKNYRDDPTQSYRLGYAESMDGIHWRKYNDKVGIEKSTTGWDSQMLEYSYVFSWKKKTYLFYNGNGFGESGFGYALLEEQA